MFSVQVKSLMSREDIDEDSALSIAIKIQNELSGPLLAARVMEAWSSIWSV